MDLDALLGASKGAGHGVLLQPEQPGGHRHRRQGHPAFHRRRWARVSPNTTVLVDEAYYEYATMPGLRDDDPARHREPRVVVARTFSKCFGMAGLRVGYAIGHRDTIKKMADWDGTGALSTVLGLRALARRWRCRRSRSWDAESKRNNEARAFTHEVVLGSRLHAAPTRRPTSSSWTSSGRRQQFRDACAKEDVWSAATSRPTRRSHARISIGTMAEMQRAVADLRDGRSASAKAANPDSPRSSRRVRQYTATGSLSRKETGFLTEVVSRLARVIGLSHATSLVVGTIIGASIFVQASEITARSDAGRRGAGVGRGRRR